MEYEFEILQNDEWQAGGTTADAAAALREARHFELMYGQDGPVTTRFYSKQELTREEMEALTANA